MLLVEILLIYISSMFFQHRAIVGSIICNFQVLNGIVGLNFGTFYNSNTSEICTNSTCIHKIIASPGPRSFVEQCVPKCFTRYKVFYYNLSAQNIIITFGYVKVDLHNLVFDNCANEVQVGLQYI